MHGGKFTAQVANVPAIAYTATQGYGSEGHPTQGKADKSVTVYSEFLNDTTPSKINAFIDRAATALSVNREELLVKDQHGQISVNVTRGQRGSSVEGGPVGQAGPYL
jgi:hypothetical protein